MHFCFGAFFVEWAYNGQSVTFDGRLLSYASASPDMRHSLPLSLRYPALKRRGDSCFWLSTIICSLPLKSLYAYQGMTVRTVVRFSTVLTQYALGSFILFTGTL